MHSESTSAGDRGIRLLCFDLDGTLCDCTAADNKAYGITARLGAVLVPSVDMDQVIRAYRACIDLAPFSPGNRVPVREWRIGFWEDALRAQDAANRDAATRLHDCFYEERLKYYRFLPGVEHMLEALRDRYILALITNGDAAIQDPKIAACGAPRLFHHLIVSGREPEGKPAQSIFHKTCRCAGCLPQEAIHVGDSFSCDVLGAVGAGFAAAVWVADAPQAKTPADAPQHVRISRVTDLPSVLASRAERADPHPPTHSFSL